MILRRSKTWAEIVATIFSFATTLATVLVGAISSKAIADQIQVINCTAVKNLATVLVSSVHTVSIFKDPNNGICRFSIDGAVQSASSPWSTNVKNALAGFNALQQIYQEDLYVEKQSEFDTAIDNLRMSAVYLMSAAGPSVDGKPAADLSAVLEKNAKDVQGCFQAFFKGEAPNLSSADGQVTCKTIQDQPNLYLELTVTPYDSSFQSVLYTYR